MVSEEGISAELERQRDLREDALSSIASGTDLSAEAFDRAGLSAEYFFTQTDEGLSQLLQLSSSVAGGFATAFEGAYEAVGQKAGAFFTLFKGFAIAQATISAYEAANKALASLPPPFSYAAAGAALAAGLGNCNN